MRVGTLGMAAGAVLCSGCLSVDFLFLQNPRLETYDLGLLDVPDHLAEEVSFDRGDGLRLAGVWARQEEPSPPLIFFHGAQANVQDSFDRIAYLWSWGRHDVFAVDYAGYGPSQGNSTWDNLANRDGQGAVDYVSATTDTPPERIVWVAASVGGFIAIHTARDRPAQAMVLQSVYASGDLLVDTSTSFDIPPGWAFTEDWDNVGPISEVTTPVLIVHGLADDVIPAASATLLFEAAAGPKDIWLPPEVNHGDLYELRPDAFETRANDWFDLHRP